MDRCAVPEHALERRTGTGRRMKRDDLRRLFAQARALTGETDYVVLGSLAALGSAGELPPRMAISLDVDVYGKSDPGRIFGLRRRSARQRLRGRTATTSIRSRRASPPCPMLGRNGWRASSSSPALPPGSSSPTTPRSPNTRAWSRVTASGFARA
jgi:hypothetical protein